MTKQSHTQAIACKQIFDGEMLHHDCVLLVSGEKVLGIKPRQEMCPSDISHDFGDKLLAPGLIDIQVNGGGDVLFNNSTTLAGLETIVQAHRKYGTTRIMPTIISDTEETRSLAAKSVALAQHSKTHGVLGLHLEGPFFGSSKRGAHKEKFIRALGQHDIDALQQLAQEMMLIVTLAPEAATPNAIEQLCKSGIYVWLGHSDASYQQTRAALKRGAAGFTHTFNAMSSITARDPGLLGAALEDEQSYCGLIADGHHVHPSNIRLLLSHKAKGKVVLVSDAMATVGGNRGRFELYGETLREVDGKLQNNEGNLAGSAISLIDAVRWLCSEKIVELQEALRMASLYPARSLGLEHQLGRLSENYFADFICLDSKLHVHASACAGKIQLT